MGGSLMSGWSNSKNYTISVIDKKKYAILKKRMKKAHILSLDNNDPIKTDYMEALISYIVYNIDIFIQVVLSLVLRLVDHLLCCLI